jgi:hypothetical protein
MPKALHDLVTDAPMTDAHRHAYNAAFDELGLNWHWDAATYAWIQAHGRDGLRTYLEREHAHLLCAYEADFLVNAIESAKARCLAGATANRSYAASVCRQDRQLVRSSAGLNGNIQGKP